MTTRILTGDCRAILPTLDAESVNCCVTSPPYFGLRSYLAVGHEDKAKELGAEQTPADYIAGMVAVFRDVRRVLRGDGTLWVNIGDSYNAQPSQRKTTDAAGPKQLSNTASVGAPSRHDPMMKPKDLMMIPARLAIALQEDGWWLRSDIIWHKPNPMPESVTDRPTSAHEHIFLLTKSKTYWYDAGSVRESARSADRAQPKPESKTISPNGDTPWLNNRYAPGASGYGVNPDGRNLRNVWTIATSPYAGAHFATYPSALVEPCIKAGCPVGGTVLDPFLGSGTTLMVADRLGRNGVGIELNPDYARLAEERITGDCPMFAELETA